MTNVGLVFGGRSVEHRVSVVSARTVARGLAEAGYRVVPLGISTSGAWVGRDRARRALDGDLDSLDAEDGRVIRSSLRALLEAEVDAVFPVTHGTWGEDGALQGLCEMVDLPYVGTGVAASAVAMDKVLAKSVLAVRGLPVVDWVTVERSEWQQGRETVLASAADLGRPAFVKPAVGGSSVGVARVDDGDDLGGAIDEAFRFDDKLLVERGVLGREIECAVLGGRPIEASVLGEIVPGKEFYDYADKYLEDGAQLLAPAQVPSGVEAELRDAAVRAFAAIGGHGMARVDFLVDDRRWWINEINTLPGFTDISMYPRLWALSGISLPDLVDRLVRLALQRHAARARLDDGIRAWIDDLADR